MAARYSSGPRLFLSDVRLCFSDPLPRRIELQDNEGHYLRDVLRLGVGSHLEVGDPSSGTIGLATIESTRDPVSITITAWIRDERPRERPIVILCALCKGDKNEQICDWSTELGCSEIHFWQSPRSVVRLKGPDDCAHRAARFAKIATAAAQQSKQTRPPKVAVHLSLEAALQALPELPSMGRYLCSLEPDSQPLSTLCAASSTSIPALVIIGPEGDITPEERTLLAQQSKVTPVTLGPSVLRSELAVVSAVSVIRAADSIKSI
jgi:16S rRNA (uracil1498-N3)-methyltransferase